MALNKDKLITDIEGLLKTPREIKGNENAETIYGKVAQELATAIEAYVKTGQITVKDIQTKKASGGDPDVQEQSAPLTFDIT